MKGVIVTYTTMVVVDQNDTLESIDTKAKQQIVGLKMKPEVKDRSKNPIVSQLDLNRLVKKD